MAQSGGKTVKIKDVVGWIGLAIALLTAGIGLYRSIITSQLITAQNQERIEDIGKLLDGMMDKQINLQMWQVETEARLRALEEGNE